MTLNTYSVRRLRWSAGALTLLVAGLLTAGPVGATAIADGSATATLTVGTITCIPGGGAGDCSNNDNLVLDLNASQVSLEDLFTQGTGTGSAVGSVAGAAVGPLMSGDTVTLMADADAMATPNGSAEALALTDAFIFLKNESASEIFTIDFSLTYSASASASITDPVHEFALAGGFVELDVLFDNRFDLMVEILADTELNLFDDPVLGVVYPFTLMLSPGTFEELVLFVDASAQAAHVPEPGTLLLLGAGLVFFAGRRATAG